MQYLSVQTTFVCTFTISTQNFTPQDTIVHNLSLCNSTVKVDCERPLCYSHSASWTGTHGQGI